MKSARREIDVVTQVELAGGGGAGESQTPSAIRVDLRASGTNGRAGSSLPSLRHRRFHRNRPTPVPRRVFGT